ncbi:trigger factor [Coxiella burnetii]|uniref:Trigger factor n=1 Tax=Coxiella burnetii (strain RSA 493 / Nine Mile phase I) TaxID=227377 RepID=TIG_COXBU|nr:trigger factor [Coxiella burnetii]NP_819763.1 trigger factor [Coxiella burnetii RSA 493]Q83DJ3.1 RecName: Full=Trigger factor; Short=TF; AltName: Full=PPIase [Coxiella burnetii RSA 493]AAO90277.1 trigger factor, ppiase [Coxiella burnetii RSA 493]AML49819.1 trigger factor [Coxiella burnetii]AML55707.1 trigger factor [Coxiella burnetii]ARI65576.1 trigger factor [Coxiella burnetii]ARK27054.1 trigger factor [Coxiella burnetii]
MRGNFMSSIEKLGGLKQRLTITVPAEEVDKAYKSRLLKVARTAKIPKFRPGKASPAVVEKLYGKAILQEVGSELIQSSLREAVEEHQLRVAGAPDIKMDKILRGEPFKYVVNFEVYPEITLESLAGETIERTQVEITEEDLDKMLEALRKQYAEWKEMDRPAKADDRVIIDFEGTLDGKPFERGSAKDFQLELGSKRMIAGFEEGIEGMKPGESKALDITFPADYPSEDLAGKAAVFNITLQKVMAPELPVLDEQFAERLGIKEGGLEALRQKVRTNMEKEVHHHMENKLKMAVLDKLIERNPIEVPESLIEAEIDHLQQMTRQQVAMQTHKPDEAKKMELPRDPYREQATKRVKLGLLLAEVVKQHKIKADPEQLRARVEEVAASYQDPEKVISWYYTNKQMLSEIESVVLEDQAVAQLMSELEVKDQAIPYEEAVKQIQQ